MGMDKVVDNSDTALEQSVALNKLVFHLLEAEKNKFSKALVAFAIVILVLFATIVYILYDSANSREALLKEVSNSRVEFLNYLQTLETTETTTQTVEGEGANLINGNTYKDSTFYDSDNTKRASVGGGQ